MWGQTWSNIADLALPYSGVEDEDLTLELIKQVQIFTMVDVKSLLKLP